ncbi:hypothetical protein EV356DRAFT_563291 [Viridothelium virens]|uniref:Ino eighty subunit 1 n=1 Tax=Viridothelium virens TaxID=1048519 RepID=A0A6A6HME3_VIRVR|nr:hypothetical protein EV356DRAFT_563291 [Viridothelium virens]
MSQASPQQQADAPDSRNTLRHILAAEPEEDSQRIQEAEKAITQDEATKEAEDSVKTERDARSQSPTETPHYTSTTQTTRRNANGSVSSVYSGNKIRHLKKEDGVPLWRKDIQFDFLRAVFEDTTAVFTRFSDGTKGHNFADVYLDAMAKSSKCSKILKDKLLTERPSALNMAMVCLLVNVGRMNTTLNFFPEMRAQLRTYHSIPALQAHQDPNAYKQLQDAPRLKSILKGATEDIEQPSTIDDIKAAKVPRTNPVNLIFVLAQYAPKISELHFHPPRDFFDLVMRSALSSKSRANAFLWLMWWYLESNFSKEDALANPFGEGQDGEATGGIPLKVPHFDYLTEEQANLENVDTKSEIEFGEQKKQERVAILATDPPNMSTGPRKGPKKGYNTSSVFGLSDDGSPARDMGTPQPGSFTSLNRSGRHNPFSDANFPSDSERTRSPSPAAHPNQSQTIPTSGMNINTLLNEDAPSPAPRSKPSKPPGPGRGNWRRNKNKDAAAASANTPNSLSDRPYKPRSLDPNHTAVNPMSTHGACRSSDEAAASLPNPNPLWNASDRHAPYTHPTHSAYHAITANGPLDPSSTTNTYFNQLHSSTSSSHAPPPPFIPTSSSLGISVSGSGPSGSGGGGGGGGGGSSSRNRSRPQTQHQLRVEQHRQQHVNYILDRKLRKQYVRSGRVRRREGAMVRTWRRLVMLPDGYDSAEEEAAAAAGGVGGGKGGAANAVGASGAPVRSMEQEMVRMGGVGGLVPLVRGSGVKEKGREKDDWGEEADAWGRAVRRFARRFERWESGDPELGVRKGRSGLSRGEEESGRADDEKREEDSRGEERRMHDEGYSSPLRGADGDEGEAEKERVAAEAERMVEEDEDEDEGDEDEDRDMDEMDGEDSDSDGDEDDDRMAVD